MYLTSLSLYICKQNLNYSHYHVTLNRQLKSGLINNNCVISQGFSGSWIQDTLPWVAPLGHTLRCSSARSCSVRGVWVQGVLGIKSSLLLSLGMLVWSSWEHDAVMAVGIFSWPLKAGKHENPSKRRTLPCLTWPRLGSWVTHCDSYKWFKNFSNSREEGFTELREGKWEDSGNSH